MAFTNYPLLISNYQIIYTDSNIFKKLHILCVHVYLDSTGIWNLKVDGKVLV